MLNFKCPICFGEVVSRCSCVKGHSTCENNHKFHFSFKRIKLNEVEVELHEGHGSHFSDVCDGTCKVLDWKK